MKYSLQQLAKLAGALRVDGGENPELTLLCTDSRLAKPDMADTTLFVALKSARGDGHTYLPALAKQGFRYFMVNENAGVKMPAGTTGIVCHNTLESLQKIAEAHRNLFRLPVVGITGSNGKTVVKEWLWQLLRHDFTICRSPGSFNSQLGVPLSVLALQKEHRLALFEAGISKPGEMEKLQRIIRPNLVVLTHMGPAHAEGFQSQAQKLEEKLKLASEADVLVSGGLQPEDEAAVKAYCSRHFIKYINWSLTGGPATVVATALKHGQHTTLNCLFNQTPLQFSLPFSDDASIANALTCMCVLLAVERLSPEHVAAFGNLQPVAMRLHMKQAINGCVLINDSYNSDLHSLQVALHFMERQNPRLGKTVVLSDLDETGTDPGTLYTEVGRLLREHRVDKLIAVGGEIAAHRQALAFARQAVYYDSTEAALASIDTSKVQDEMMLLKGARRFRFEQLDKLLAARTHQTTVEINLDAVVHNLNVYRGLLSAGTKIMAMVKAFSYGSGSFELAKLLQHYQVDYLAVAYADEGIELRKAGITLPVMVMNPEADSLRLLLDFGLEPVVYSFSMLEQVVQATAGNRRCKVHIEFDTGMHRLGFETDDTDKLLAALLQHPHLEVASVYSHLAASDEPLHDDFTVNQLALFTETCHRFTAALHYPVLKHIANSAAIARLPQCHLDMVRLGLGLHGLDASGKLPLMPVSRFRSVISQVKEVRQGDTIGYSRRTVADRTMQIGIVALGYADGLNRLLSNRGGSLYVNGKACQVVGNVCMDMCMIDLSNCPAQPGHEVVVFENANQLNALATTCHTIPYEILTGISQRVSRVYFQE